MEFIVSFEWHQEGLSNSGSWWEPVSNHWSRYRILDLRLGKQSHGKSPSPKSISNERRVRLSWRINKRREYRNVHSLEYDNETTSAPPAIRASWGFQFIGCQAHNKGKANRGTFQLERTASSRSGRMRWNLHLLSKWKLAYPEVWSLGLVILDPLWRS